MPYAFPLLHTPGNPGSSCYPAHLPAVDQPDDFLHWVYQQTPGPVEIIDQLGRTTTFNYCDPIADGLPGERIAAPSCRWSRSPIRKARSPSSQYDGRRNISRVTRHPARPLQPNGQPWPTSSPRRSTTSPTIRSQTKPLSMTDARGNTTDYTYAPEHGGLLTETGPAP